MASPCNRLQCAAECRPSSRKIRWHTALCNAGVKAAESACAFQNDRHKSVTWSFPDWSTLSHIDQQGPHCVLHNKIRLSEKINIRTSSWKERYCRVRAHKPYGLKGILFLSKSDYVTLPRPARPLTKTYAVAWSQLQKLNVSVTFSWQSQFPQDFTLCWRGKYHLYSQPPSWCTAAVYVSYKPRASFTVV